VNLLDNAVKYTARGSVTVAARAGTGGLQVTVADTGSGMAAEDLPHVFDRFYRADQGRTEHGTGLGLAIARQIAQGHGGALTVESTPNMGSIFTVSLPT
ncbi:MAG TPA: sensor histidine kinase, partial [Anaerolineae bacterium]|nr:sensor histidine kinase [Anaerolineae bacterium]